MVTENSPPRISMMLTSASESVLKMYTKVIRVNQCAENVSLYSEKPFNLTACYITKCDMNAMITCIEIHGQHCTIMYKL